MQKRFLGFILSMTVLFVGLGGCTRVTTLKIGVVGPLSGPLAEYGKDIANGAQLAVDELNSHPIKIGNEEIRFEIVREDDKGSIDEGRLAAVRLSNAKVTAVIGHFNSAVSIAAAPIYAEVGIPQISVSTSPTYTKLGLPTTFRITASDTKQGEAIGTLIYNGLKSKSVVLIDDQTVFGKGLKQEVEKTLQTSGEKIESFGINKDGADYEAIASKIKLINPDTIFFGGDEVVGTPLLQAIKKLNINAKIVTGDAMCSIPVLKQTGLPDDGNYFCSVAGVPPSWLYTGIGFVDKYRQKYNVLPGPFSPMAFDSINILSEAIKISKSTNTKDITSALKKHAFAAPIAGSVEFDEKGDIKNGTVVYYQWLNGALQERPINSFLFQAEKK